MIEAELADSRSGDVLGLLVDDLSETTGKEKSQDSWGKLHKAFEFYAKRFRGRLDADR